MDREQNQPGQPEPMLSIGQVATWLGIPERTLYAWRVEGKGPIGHRVGRHVRYRREDVEAWLGGQRDAAG